MYLKPYHFPNNWTLLHKLHFLWLRSRLGQVRVTLHRSYNLKWTNNSSYDCCEHALSLQCSPTTTQTHKIYFSYSLEVLIPPPVAIMLLCVQRGKHTAIWTQLCISPYVPSSTTSVLSLAVEVNCSDRGAEVVDRCEVPGVEIWSPPWCIGGLPDCLPEQDEHKAMDSGSRTWALIGNYFVAWYIQYELC